MTENKIVRFGKHAGTLWTRIPVSYLNWLINECKPNTERFKMAKFELERRGTLKDVQIELSPHAIDRASLRLRGLWQAETYKKIGLYTWLHERALKAYKGEEETISNGVKFIFKVGNFYPVLKTVMPRKR